MYSLKIAIDIQIMIVEQIKCNTSILDFDCKRPKFLDLFFLVISIKGLKFQVDSRWNLHKAIAHNWCSELCYCMLLCKSNRTMKLFRSLAFKIFHRESDSIPATVIFPCLEIMQLPGAYSATVASRNELATRVYNRASVEGLPRRKRTVPTVVKNSRWWFSCPIPAIRIKLYFNKRSHSLSIKSLGQFFITRGVDKQLVMNWLTLMYNIVGW